MENLELDANAVRSVLTESPLFREVDLDVLGEDLMASPILEVAAGAVLLDPAAPNAEIFVVLDGSLLVCLEPRPSNPLVELGRGDCVGELSIIDARPPSAYVVAATASRLLAIPREVLWRMLTNQPRTALNLLTILTQRIRENNATLLNSLELQREYRNKAETDVLTGLRNRAWMEEVFPKQLDLCERIGQYVSLLIIDVDHFKRINDRFGHRVGDEALRHLGFVLRRNLRSTDLCARYGGEEVVVLMPATDIVSARLTAERLRHTISSAPFAPPDGQPLTMTVSGGIAEWQPGTRLDALIQAADQALYRAKADGRNRIAVSGLTGSFVATTGEEAAPRVEQRESR